MTKTKTEILTKTKSNLNKSIVVLLVSLLINFLANFIPILYFKLFGFPQDLENINNHPVFSVFLGVSWLTLIITIISVIAIIYFFIQQQRERKPIK